MAKAGRVLQVVGLLIAICGGIYLSAFFAGLFGPAEGPTARSLSATLFGELPSVIGIVLLGVGALMRWVAGAR